MSWFEKLMPSRISTEKRTRSVPEGVWIKCARCDAQLYRNELERNLQVCPKCHFHMRIGARRRLDAFLDPDSEQELFANLEPEDPLRFRDRPCSDALSWSALSNLRSWVVPWGRSSVSVFRAPRGTQERTACR
jgi:acetyl-CoA carboxylase beta subunit